MRRWSALETDLFSAAQSRVGLGPRCEILRKLCFNGSLRIKNTPLKSLRDVVDHLSLQFWRFLRKSQLHVVRLHICLRHSRPYRVIRMLLRILSHLQALVCLQQTPVHSPSFFNPFFSVLLWLLAQWVFVFWFFCCRVVFWTPMESAELCECWFSVECCILVFLPPLVSA